MATQQNDISQLFEGMAEEKGTIDKIEVSLSQDVFGDKAQVKDRMVAEIYTIYSSSGEQKTIKEAHAVPQGMKWDGSSWVIVNKLQAQQSVQNLSSWFGKFYRIYRGMPVPKMDVRVAVNAKGFVGIRV